MKLPREVIDELTVHPGRPAALSRRGTAETRADWLGVVGRSHPREVAEADLEELKKTLSSAQELLYASGSVALLVLLQALDAAGKDGTIKHVMSGVNPQGCEVFSFKQPSLEELRHDFLWRYAKALPERGRIGIFNRSYYEEVLVCRVHPELLAAQHLPEGAHGDRFWSDRFEDINAFEHHLDRNGTRIVKLFLHISRAEQRKRLLERLDDPQKHWKLSPSDVAEHARFAEYQGAYEEALSATSTPWAPWYVVPADHKFALRALVGGIIVDRIEQLDLRLPTLGKEATRALEEARETLGRE